MMLGLSLPEFTLLHVAISLVGIAAGLLFLGTLSTGRWSSLWNGLFLIFTILTSVTGFLFPPKPIGPPFIFGVVSLGLLAIALFALYGQKLRRSWRITYLVTALLAQWLNMVVLVVQSFQKIPALNALAPTGSEPAVLAGQGIVLLIILFFAWRTIPSRLGTVSAIMR
jgi:hypothetical protein